MKILTMYISLMIGVFSYGAEPLVSVAEKELEKSKHFLKLEKIRREHIYDYTKMVKARYLLTKKTPFLSDKISNGLTLKASAYGKGIDD